MTIAVIQQCKQIILDEGIRIQQLIDDNTELTTDEIVSSMNEIAELMATKSKYDLTIQGAGMTGDEVAQFQSDLEYLEGQIAERASKFSGEEDDKLISELVDLCLKRSDIELVLTGAESTNRSEILKSKLDMSKVRGEASGLLLNIGYSEGSTITQEILEDITNSLAHIGDLIVELDVILTHKTMREEDRDLDDGENIVHETGGYNLSGLDQNELIQLRNDVNSRLIPTPDEFVVYDSDEFYIVWCGIQDKAYFTRDYQLDFLVSNQTDKTVYVSLSKIIINGFTVFVNSESPYELPAHTSMFTAATDRWRFDESALEDIRFSGTFETVSVCVDVFAKATDAYSSNPEPLAGVECNITFME